MRGRMVAVNDDGTEADFSEEAIPERSPYYRLPCEPGDGRTGPTMTRAEAITWLAMVAKRPSLAALEEKR